MSLTRWRQRGVAVPSGRGLRRRVVTAASFNLVSTAANAVGGIVIARALGPTDRGAYAAIIAWFGVVLVVGELGQTAATTFFVARNPDQARDYVTTSRAIMLVAGASTLVVGYLAAPWLAQGGGETVLVGYQLMFAVCMVSFLGASYVFGMQATSISKWNTLRTYQPLTFVAVVFVLDFVGHLDLTSTLLALSGSIVVQTVLAYLMARRAKLTGGRFRRRLVRPMGHFGFGQLAASLPTLATQRLDQLVLSLTVAPAVLGNYAIATSLMALAQPVTTALGAVAFPMLASRMLSPHMAARMHRGTVLASLTVAILLLVPLAVAAPWLIPAVFGTAFRPAVSLVILLVPAGICLAGAQVCGDLLRGYGQPLAVARAQLAAAAVSVVLLAVLVPTLGVAGAAIASSSAAAVALLLMLRQLATAALTYDGRAARPVQEAGDRLSPTIPDSIRPGVGAVIERPK